MIEATAQILGTFGLGSIALALVSLLNSIYLAKKLSNKTHTLE